MRISSKDTNEMRRVFNVKYVRTQSNTFWNCVSAENLNDIAWSLTDF